MELTHQFTVPASIDSAWSTFMDLGRVGACFPGATITDVTDDGFSGTVKVKLGPIALTYAGSGRFVERDDTTHRAVIEANGKDKRGNGTAGAKVTIQLAEVGDQTQVDVSTDLSVTGKPAQFGRGVMQDVSDKLLQQFVGCVEGQFAQEPDSGSAAGSASAVGDAAATDDDAPPVESSATSPPAAAAAPAATTSQRAPQPTTSGAPSAEPEAIDLGTTVVPVLLKSYGPYLLAGIVGLVLGILVGGSVRHRSRS